MRKSFLVSCVLLVGLALLPTTLSADPSFRVGRGKYLWHVWEAPPYRQAFSSWPEFRSAVAKLNNLPDGEKAFRSLETGREIKLPVLPGTISSERFQAEVLGLRTQIQGLEKELSEARQAIQSQPEALPVQEELNSRLWLIVSAAAFGVTLIGLGTLLARSYRRRSEVEKEIESLKKESLYRLERLRKVEDEFSLLTFYANKHLVAVRPPADIGKVLGKENSVVYLPKADPIEGDEAVFFPRRGAVKVKNVKRCFDQADEEVLNELGILKAERKELSLV